MIDRVALAHFAQARARLGFELTAAQIAAYFNFVNRLVLGLGVGLEEDREGYRY